MNTGLSIAIIFVVVELISFITKKWFPGFVRYLPVMNTAIGALGSLIFKTDILAGLATAGISCAGYDFVHGLIKDAKGE